MKSSENAGSIWITRMIAAFSSRTMTESAITATVARRLAWPARHASPKKSLAPSPPNSTPDLAAIRKHVYILAMLYIELAIIIVLILINGLLALAELAIVSSRRARLQALVDRDVIGSRRALALASDPGRFLSTVQIGITLVGVLSGAFSRATLGLRLAEWFAQLGLPTGVAEAVGLGLVVAVITYFSLVIGELVPKQIALRNPEKIAVRVAPAMIAIARIASPVVSFLDISGRAVLRALGYQAQAEHRVTDEEIRTLMAEAETAGVIEPGERAMIAGVMRLGDRPVRAVMTPRREVDMIDLTADPEDIRRMIVESIHSRLPVHAGTPEEMLGVVQAKRPRPNCSSPEDFSSRPLRGGRDIIGPRSSGMERRFPPPVPCRDIGKSEASPVNRWGRSIAGFPAASPAAATTDARL